MRRNNDSWLYTINYYHFDECNEGPLHQSSIRENVIGLTITNYNREFNR